ncbi:MAG: response regulator transcription factor [Streptococcaceae bacterium]|jgi:DNA-binding response OmpR family regulator|nr:response regulator transcription factor [Streptococcaceae bacterium]
MKILVVDDDKEIVDLLSIYLKNEKFEYEKAYNGEEALSLFLKEEDAFDLIILDLMMPIMDGMSVLQTLRAKKIDVPVLFLTAKSQDEDIVKGLVAGADDYVTKPFNPLEVMVRIKNILKRSEARIKVVANKIEIGPIVIDKDTHQVKTKDDNLPISLTVLEFGILLLLATHPGRVFSADEIFEQVWQQESAVPAKTVMVHVSHLRDKLFEATQERLIETVWGVGYKIEE